MHVCASFKAFTSCSLTKVTVVKAKLTNMPPVSICAFSIMLGLTVIEGPQPVSGFQVALTIPRWRRLAHMIEG